MKLQSTADGLKAVKVNPFKELLDKALVTPQSDYIQLGLKFHKFEETNPELPLVQQMPGNTVFEGVDEPVYQTRSRNPANQEWMEWGGVSFGAYSSVPDNNYFWDKRICYQPLEVKEQPLDLTANYGPGDNNYGRDKKPYVKEQVREEEVFICVQDLKTKLHPRPEFKMGEKYLLSEVPILTHGRPSQLYFQPFTDCAPKASNPEFGVSFEQTLTKHGIYEYDTRLNAAISEYVATQQQGLVSINNISASELAILIANDKYVDEMHGSEAHLSDKEQIERVILKYLKTLKQ